MITSCFISNIFSRKFETDLIILRMDGGICSQISFWALGKFYAESGFQVKFDMSWFIKNGLDTDGKFARNFDFCKLFPELKIRAAKNFECKLGRNKYGIDGSMQSSEKIVAPAYILWLSRTVVILHTVPLITSTKYFGIRKNCQAS